MLLIENFMSFLMVCSLFESYFTFESYLRKFTPPFSHNKNGFNIAVNVVVVVVVVGIVVAVVTVDVVVVVVILVIFLAFLRHP